MCFEKIEGAKNPANMLTKCVGVGILRLCKTEDIHDRLRMKFLVDGISLRVGELLG